MQRVMRHYLTREMAVLGLVEAALSFVAIYAVLTLASPTTSLPSFIETIPHDSLALAAVLTLVTGAAGLKVGLYRKDVALDHKRLLATSGVAAALVFAVLLAVSGDSNTGLSTAQALFIAKLLGVWLATMTLIRLIYGLTAHRTAPARRILLVGNARQAGACNARLRSRRDHSFDLVVLHASEISWLLLRQHRIWGIIIASEPESSAVPGLLDCKLRGMKIFSAADFYENYLGRIDLDMLSVNELLMTPGFSADGLTAALKRLSDISWASPCYR
jgi:hypothetical protein